MSTKPEQPLRVGEWCYLPAQDKLVKLDHHGDVIATAELDNLCQKALNYFLANAHRLITRDELLNDVWGVRDVSDGRISRVIRVLRVSLGDDTKDPKYIETIPKRGFRFIADVEPLVPESAEPEPVAAGVAATSSVAQDGRDPVDSALEPENATSSEHPSAVQVASQPSRRRAAYWWTALAILVGIAAFVVRFGVTTSTTDIPYKPFIPISKMAGAESHVAISSDGKYLVYVHSDKSGASEQLILQQRDGSERIVLFSSASELVSGPQFSADNQSIYFQTLARGASCQIRKITLDETRERVISNVEAIKCHPNNLRARLAISADNDYLIYPNYQEDSQNVALMLYSFKSGKSERLTIAPPTSRGDIGAYFASDSDHLAFVRDVGGTSGQIWTISLTDRTPRLLYYPTDRYPAGLTWTEDDKSILFASSKNEIKGVDVASGMVKTVLVTDSPSRDLVVQGDTLYAAAGSMWQIVQEKIANPLFATESSAKPEVLPDSIFEENPIKGQPAVVVSRRPGIQHVALRYDNGRQEKLAEFKGDFFISALEFSSDGKSLLIEYSNELWIFQSGKKPIQINQANRPIGNSSWGWEGKYVYFFVNKQGRWELNKFELTTGTVSFVTDEYDFYQESSKGHYRVWRKTGGSQIFVERSDKTVLSLTLDANDNSPLLRLVTRGHGLYFLQSDGVGYPVIKRFALETGNVENTGIRIWGAGRLFTVSDDEKFIIRDAGSRGDHDIAYIKFK